MGKKLIPEKPKKPLIKEPQKPLLPEPKKKPLITEPKPNKPLIKGQTNNFSQRTVFPGLSWSTP